MFGNNRGADQPAHLRNLTSTFVVPLLESIISRLAMSKIFKLTSVAEETGLSLALSETSKTSFVASRPKYCSSFRPLDNNRFIYFSIKTYAVGTQKNRLKSIRNFRTFTVHTVDYLLQYIPLLFCLFQLGVV